MDHLKRIRKICTALPATEEKLSHGAPTFFAGKQGVYVMYVNNHHNDGHVAVWIPAPPGLQADMIADAPATYFKPPYVGVKGWVGVELSQVNDAELTALIQQAYRVITTKRKRK